MLSISVVLAPLIGIYLDLRGAYVPILVSSLFCAIGCAARGLASNVNQLYAASVMLGLGNNVDVAHLQRFQS